MQVSTLLYALIAGLVPSLIWLWFWLREDTHYEPRWLIALAFIGGIVSVIFAVLIEKYIANFDFGPNLRYTLWALTEEVAKFLAVAIIIFGAKNYDEPIDAMVYFIVVALGFSAFENALFIIQPLSGGEIATSIITSNMRFIGATLVHIVSSASIGFTLGFVFYKGYGAKIFAGIIGLLIATALHSAFNLSIINASGTEVLKAFAWVWGAVVILIVLFEEIKIVKPKLS